MRRKDFAIHAFISDGVLRHLRPEVDMSKKRPSFVSLERCLGKSAGDTERNIADTFLKGRMQQYMNCRAKPYDIIVLISGTVTPVA